MKNDTATQISPDRLTLPMEGRDHIQGVISAPVTLLEYGDYQCPYCGKAHISVRRIQEVMGEELCFVYRHFPLVNVHLHAEHAAEAAEAAGAQEAFWEMHDALFENQDALDDESLAGYAVDLGLDEPRLSREVATGAYGRRIGEDFQSGTRAGVDGTPTFFLNGVRYEGAEDAGSMLAAIEEARRSYR